MKFNFFFILIMLLFSSCSEKNEKNILVVFPDYCGGCVSKNFLTIDQNNLNDKFKIYFDTTDSFVLNAAKMNKLSYNHIYNKDIPPKFGDHANLVIIDLAGKSTELTTNEILEKGRHYE